MQSGFFATPSGPLSRDQIMAWYDEDPIATVAWIAHKTAAAALSAVKESQDGQERH